MRSEGRVVSVAVCAEAGKIAFLSLHDVLTWNCHREDAVAALEAADNDSKAAMRFHMQSLPHGGAVRAAHQVFVSRMVKAGMSR